MQSLITAKGTHPTLGDFFHVLLPSVEKDATRLLSVVGNSAVLHELDAAGHIAETAVDIPLVREIVNVLDTITASQASAAPVYPTAQ